MNIFTKRACIIAVSGLYIHCATKPSWRRLIECRHSLTGRGGALENQGIILLHRRAQRGSPRPTRRFVLAACDQRKAQNLLLRSRHDLDDHRCLFCSSDEESEGHYRGCTSVRSIGRPKDQFNREWAKTIEGARLSSRVNGPRFRIVFILSRSRGWEFVSGVTAQFLPLQYRNCRWY